MSTEPKLDFRHLAILLIDDATPTITAVRAMIRDRAPNRDILEAVDDVIKALRVVRIAVECDPGLLEEVEP